MNDPVAAAKAAVQGVGPSQIAATPQTTVTPQAGTLGSPDALAPQIAASFQPQSQATLSNAQTGALLGTAQNAVQNSYNNWQIQHSNAIGQAFQQQQAPVKTQAEDGGYRYSWNGQQINAAQYRQLTNQTIDQQLAGSQNPLDMQARGDWNNMMQLGTALSGNDDVALGKLAKGMGYASGQQLRQKVTAAEQQSGMSLPQLYAQYYPNLFGRSGVGQTRNPSPNNPANGGNPYNFLNPQP